MTKEDKPEDKPKVDPYFYASLERESINWVLPSIEQAQEDEENPGRYISPSEKYPGYVQLPETLMLSQFKAYWDSAIKPITENKLADLDWDNWKYPLIGVVQLITEYGEWAIEGIPSGDAKTGDLPLEISEWLITVNRAYILPQLDPKRRRVVSTLI
jgi:hypothetical protein